MGRILIQEKAITPEIDSVKAKEDSKRVEDQIN